MSEIIKTRCKQGKLILTENIVKVELAGLKQETMSRSSITGIDYKLAIPSVFGIGGGASLVFHGKGAERLHADLVKPSVAKEIMALLGY